MNILRLRHHFRDEPIIQSLLDVDFYKFTMGQFIFRHFPFVKVRLAFKNRSTKVPLTSIIPIEQLREQLDHVRTLRFKRSELHFLRGTNEYGERMFAEDYLEFLKDLQLPAYELRYEGGQIVLEFFADWRDVTYWETLALSIINELYYRNRLKSHSRFEIEAIHAEGVRRLWQKVKILRDNPQIVFTDFGTRRRFSRDWHNYVVSVLAEELPSSQFRGTSNTAIAMQHIEEDLLPMGTNAHELQMVIAGLMSDTDENLRRSQSRMLDLWWQTYGEALSIFLPDTFGTHSFLKLLNPKWARAWKGFRLDSGDPFIEGDQIIAYYKEQAVNPLTKMLIPSDGLELPIMIELEKHFRNRIGTLSFGWGTNLTNDLGLETLSLVVKAIEANGAPLVKLPNNLAKSLGEPHSIARYKRVFGYSEAEHQTTACKY